ncbi:MAG TPA: MATE family efflux transporter [Candidatus Solibacter sp.]
MIVGFRKEIRPMLRLGVPLALAELGWMAMGFVDTVMAGRLGAAAIGAGALGGMLFFPIAVCGTGMLLGMDTLVSQAFGARDDDACHRTFLNGLWIALLLAPVVALLLALTIPALRVTGTNPDVLNLLAPFLRALLWGIPPLLFFTAFRRYLQAQNIVRPITFAVVSANIVNFAGNWLLMYGHWGAPRMGLEGSGISTSFSRLYIALVLLIAVRRHERRLGNRIFHIDWRPDFPGIHRLLALGFPSAMQILFEGAVFAVVTVLASHLDEFSLAAHGIAVNVISITYMVPLGISSAAAVRVGQAIGRKDPRGIAVAGWTALLLAALFMGSAGLGFTIAPRWIARLYTPDAAVIAAGVTLLRIAALFQIFDGLQVVATGALRGLGDTRTPAYAHLIGYWIFGMPVAWLLCFHYGWGVSGIWVGLTIALVMIGLILIFAWRRALLDRAF